MSAGLNSAAGGLRGPRRRLRGWRLAGRFVRCMALLMAVVAVLILFGWRYGFRPLPTIDPAGLAAPHDGLSGDEVTPGHPWYWVEQLGTLPDLDGSYLTPLTRFLELYAEAGWGALTNRAEAAAWIAQRPLLPECYERILLAAAGQPDLRAIPAGEVDTKTWRARTLLRSYALWQAAEAERRGESLQAFESLLWSWRLHALLGPSYTSYAWGPAVVWRRLALTAPLPSEADARRLLSELRRLSDQAPSLEEAFLHQAGRTRPDRLAEALFDEGNGLTPRRRLHEAVGDFLDEVVRCARWLVSRVMLGETEEPPSPSGGDAVLRILGTGCQVVLVGVMRTNDLAHMHAAYTSGVVARLRAGQTNEAIAWAKALRDRPHRWIATALADRPLVWTLAPRSGDPESCLRALRQGQLRLEACRLTLALRMYRAKHGAWPETLSALTPDILPAEPLDPVSGTPFLYRAGSDGYVFASRGHGDRSEEWLLSTNRLRDSLSEHTRQTFASAEPEAALRGWTARRAVLPVAMDLQMMRRYGLLPQGATVAGTNLVLPGSVRPAGR